MARYSNIMLIILSVVLLVFIMIISSIAAGKAKNAKCFSKDINLQLSHKYSTITAICSGILAFSLAFIVITVYGVFKEKPWGWEPGKNIFGLGYGGFIIALLSAVIISSSISAIYTHQSKCKNKDSDAEESYRSSVIAAVTSAIVVILIAIWAFAYSYPTWIQPRVIAWKRGINKRYEEPEMVAKRLSAQKEIEKIAAESKRRTLRDIERIRLKAEEDIALLLRKKKGKVSPETLEAVGAGLFPARRISKRHLSV